MIKITILLDLCEKILKDGMYYVGYISDLKRRFSEHSEGLVKSTKFRLPLEIVYYEANCEVY